jgi:hypothetical protein
MNKMKEGPSESALQVQASNYCSDASEVTLGCEARAEKAGKTCQVRMKEMSESEPSDEVSGTSYLLSKPSYSESKGRACQTPVVPDMRQSSQRWHDFHSGLFVERRKPFIDVKGKQQAGSPCKPITKAVKGGGSARSSDEGFVMKLEQRG